MGYPTIDRFDVKFIERTLTNIKAANSPNKFTHLLNSLIGLIFIPHEFNRDNKRKYSMEFLNKKISQFPTLAKMFTGEADLKNEQGVHFRQTKFFLKNTSGKRQSTDTTAIGELVRLFRNGIAHQNIIPVAEGNYWKGVIVRNYQNPRKESEGDFNFETFLNQRELREFSTFVAIEYLRAARSNGRERT